MPDNLTPEQRKYCMSRIKSKDTKPELIVSAALRDRGLTFEQHVKELPGRPDIVFPEAKVVVFVDGDFWHGYRFPQWQGIVSPFWQEKIGKTRKRDQRNFAKLRRMGWTVIRVWQHTIKKDLTGVIAKICDAIRTQRPSA